jgi:glycosyltransferase involved in cell wall biosynthesis
VAVTDRVVVSVPYFRCRGYVHQALESVLGQTHENLTVVVINDGDPGPPWDLLADVDDPRLVTFDLPRNRGRYFADQVVLAATNAPFLLIQDADDWSEPHRIEVLLRELRRAHAVAAFSASFRPPGRGGRIRIAGAEGMHRPFGPKFVHRGNFTGLYRTEVLRAVGGFYAGFRVGFDSFLVNAVGMTGPVAVCDEPLYHRRSRPDSLTAAPATGGRSALRRRELRAIRRLYADAFAAYTEYLDGAIDAEGLRRRIRERCDARVSPRARRELAEHTAQLAAKLARRPSPEARARVPRAGRVAMEDLLGGGAQRRRPECRSNLLFWSSLDLQAWRRDRRAEWIEYRFRHWLAFTLPSILAQRVGDFRYWLVCDPAGRAITERLAQAIKDDRVRLVYADECPALLRRLPAADRHLVARLDSDDMYHPDVAGDLLERRATTPFLQFNRGHVCDVRSGQLCGWKARSSPFYCHVYGDELRTQDPWSEPNHSTVRPLAEELGPGRFLVTIHDGNTTSSLPLRSVPLDDRRRRRVLEAFGLGVPRSLDALLACARGPANWTERAPALRASVGRRRQAVGDRLSTEAAAFFAFLCEATAARRIRVTGSALGAAIARNYAPTDDAGPAYDLALTDAEGTAAALQGLLPSGLALIHDEPARVDVALRGCCADTYPEVRALTRDERGCEAALVGRAMGAAPAAPPDPVRFP